MVHMATSASRIRWLYLFFITVVLVLDAKASAKNTGILPKSFTPLHYDIEITPDFYKDDPKNFSQTCKTSILVECTAVTKELVFHSSRLTIDWSKFSLTSANGKTKVKVGKQSYDMKTQMWRVELKSSLVKGSKYKLLFESRGRIRVGALFGLHASGYEAQGKKRYLISIQAQPVFARTIFPCFDEPGFKATFSVTVRRKEGFIALSNTRLINSTKGEDGWVADRFEKTPKMPTYTVGVVVVPEDYRHLTSHMVQNERQVKNVSIWRRPGYSCPSTSQYLLKGAILMMKAMQGYLNISYPLPKIDHVTIPQFPLDGGMESWGLLTYREQSVFQKDLLRGVANMGHEIAHQWFGNLVTLATWSDLWLNEGLASYFTLLAQNLDLRKPFPTESRMAVLDGDSYMTALPVKRNAQTLNDIMSMFSSAVYRKSPYLIRMFHYTIGEEAMRVGLKKYVSKHSYSTATTLSFCDTFNKTVKKIDHNPFDVQSFLVPWLEQRNHPLVTISLKNKKLVIKQEPFQKPGFPKDSGMFILKDYFNLTEEIYTAKYDKYGHKWRIPLTLVTNTSKVDDQLWKGNEKLDIIWINGAEATVAKVNGKTLDHRELVLADPSHVGFYRVNYDTTLWKRLIEQLIKNYKVFPLENRRQIVYDVMEFLKLEKISPDLPLILGDYMKQTLDPYQWELFLNGTSYYADILESYKSKLYQPFKKFMVSLMAPVINSIRSTKDSKLRQILEMWSFRYGNSKKYQVEKYKSETISVYLTKSIKNSKNTDRIEDVMDQAMQDGFVSDVLDLYLKNLAFFHDREMHGLLLSIAKGTASAKDAKMVKDIRLSHPLVVKTWRDEIIMAEEIIIKNIKWAKGTEKDIEPVLRKYM